MNFAFAGVASALPPGSSAYTRKTCLPSETRFCQGELHGFTDFSSRLHRNLGSGSVAVNVTFTLRFVVFGGGKSVSVVSGGVESSR